MDNSKLGSKTGRDSVGLPSDDQGIRNTSPSQSTSTPQTYYDIRDQFLQKNPENSGYLEIRTQAVTTSRVAVINLPGEIEISVQTSHVFIASGERIPMIEV